MVISTSWATVYDATTYMYVAEWTSNESGLAATDINWDFIFDNPDGFLDYNVKINVRKDSETDEWVVSASSE